MLSDLLHVPSTKVDYATATTPELRQELLQRRNAYLKRPPTRPRIQLCDKNLIPIARIENYEEATWEELAVPGSVGTAQVDITGTHMEWLRDIVLRQTKPEESLYLVIDPDENKPHDWRNRWGGFIDTITHVDEEGQPSKTVLQATSFADHLSYISVAANPVFPMEAQLPKQFMWGGSTASTCAFTTFLNLFRLFALNAWYLIPRDLMNPQRWIDLNILDWPIQVMPISPILDQTRWCTLSSRWKDAKTVFTPLMKDAGVICRAYTWMPGDPAPYGEFFSILGTVIAENVKPTRACIILSFEDKSGVTGPTGTMLDGGLNLIASTADDMITSMILPMDPKTGTTDPFFRRLLGVAPKPSPFVYRDAPGSGMKHSEIVIHKRRATDIITGGKSPAWLNQAITFAIRYGLSQLAQVINYGIGAYEQYGVEGLDNLYQGQLDDCFLAFMRYRNPLASMAAGPYARNEYFETGSGTAYVINSLQTLAEGDYKNRAYVTHKFDVGDVSPFIVGEDYALGDRVVREFRGTQYTDQVLAIKTTCTRTEAGRPMITLGDDSREEDPVVRAFRTIGNVANFAALLASAGDMF